MTISYFTSDSLCVLIDGFFLSLPCQPLMKLPAASCEELKLLYDETDCASLPNW